jgi:hypothetical protein
MSVATAAASAISGSSNNNNINTGAFGGILGGTKAGRLFAKAQERKKQRQAAAQARFAGSAIGQAMGLGQQGPRGKAARISSLEERVSALEDGGGEDVTQPSPTVDVPVSPEEGIGAAPAMPEPTMGAAEKMFGGGAIRQIAMGVGKFKK